jgi:hypothetical protein
MTIPADLWCKTFDDYLAQGELRLPFHPATGAPLALNDRRHDAHSREPAQWRVSPGKGKILSYVVFRRPYAAGMATPCIQAWIELAEGHRLVAPLADVAPESAKVGMAVELAGKPGVETLIFKPQ